MKITIDESKIEYRRPRGIIGTVLAYVSRWLRNITTVTPVNPPYNYKGIKRVFKSLKNDEIGKTIRIEPNSLEKHFEVHRKRLKLYDFVSTIIYFVLSMLVTIIIIIYLAYVISQIQSAILSSLLSGLFNFISFIVGILIAALAAKIVVLLMDRRFADSLVNLSSLYLIIDLHQHDNLANPDFKRNILDRIQTLRRNVLLLSQTFVDNADRETFKKFKDIESFIREREGWTVTPKEDTLEILRKDFDKLAVIIISGQYGNFKNKKSKNETIAAPVKPLTFADKVLQLVAVTMPYVLLAVIYFKPEYFKSIGISSATIFSISIAWILLTIDMKLQLGLVDRIAGFVKTVKELK